MAHVAWKAQQLALWLAVVFAFVWFSPPELAAGAAIFGTIAGLIVTGLLMRLVDVIRFSWWPRLTRRPDPGSRYANSARLLGEFLDRAIAEDASRQKR